MKKQGIKTTRDLGNAILDIVKNESHMIHTICWIMRQ